MVQAHIFHFFICVVQQYLLLLVLVLVVVVVAMPRDDNNNGQYDNDDVDRGLISLSPERVVTRRSYGIHISRVSTDFLCRKMVCPIFEIYALSSGNLI